MSKCHRSEETQARVIVALLVLVIVLLSCFSGRANATGVFVELGTTIVHGSADEPYVAAGYRTAKGFRGAVAFWKYVEPTIYNSPYLIYDPECEPRILMGGECRVIGQGTTELPSTATRQMVAAIVDYEMKYAGFLSVSLGAGYLNRATDVEDSQVVPAVFIGLTPRNAPCGLSLRALGHWGLVGAHCTF